eukprot:TRINITY_DN2046_c0_g1_i1.p1 TRINITY_DN2046_c0_g1~~TRINITY_DN2046_c0_g1_i1.p1  ORF type:complete len:921 (+),score=167.08 TRINITY_DN2046_c0_g1_i1:50-2812(+)
MKLLAIAVLAICLVQSQAQVCNQLYRVQCQVNATSSDQCEAAGCCWNDGSILNSPTPTCFQEWEAVYGYELRSVNETSWGIEAMLEIVDGSDLYGKDIPLLQIQVFFETQTRLHVKITDPNNPSRWQPPNIIQSLPPSTVPSNMDYDFSWTESPFGFAVTRVSNGEVLFNTTPSTSSAFNGLVFKEQYLEISTVLPSSHQLYGMGQRIGSFQMQPMTYTMWNTDQGTIADTNLYGSHPVYVEIRPDGNSHGVFFFTSNGLDAVLREESMTYKAVGGVFDMYFFLGPTGDNVVQQYEDVIGKPYFPPYWTLGFHNCRWGYPNLSYVEDVVAKYRAADIPLETQWTDIDYMDNHYDFTTDPVNFPLPQFQQFVASLHDNNQHFVLIIDPGIAPTNGYIAYDNGTMMDVWIKNATGQDFVGKVWPGLTVFPDWFNENTFAYWADMITYFHNEMLPVDGLWVDMNEISNFCTGQCYINADRTLGAETYEEFLKMSKELARQAEESQHPRKSRGPFPFDPNNPPYAIQNRYESHQPLDFMTVSMDAVHTVGLEYNTHNMYGMMETWATKQALETVRGKRAFTLSRSTYVGSGRHGFNWGGDNWSVWLQMYWVIHSTINSGIFGIPMYGTEICGFNGNTNEELCGRWVQIGAFEPFCRDHNSIGQKSQELYLWPSVANISRTMFAIRYSILPYMYTLFYRAHTYGGMVWRPLVFEFPTDPNVANLDTQFLVGSSIMVSPILQPNATNVTSYFPASYWYDFYTLKLFEVAQNGGNFTLDAPFQFIPVHLLGGTILPRQYPAMTIYQTRLNPFYLLVPYNADGRATGELYLDDGDAIEPVINQVYSLLEFSSGYDGKKGQFTSQVVKTGWEPASTANLQYVIFMGVNSPVSSVDLNGNSVDFTFDPNNNTLNVTVALPILKEFTINFA